MPELNRTLTEEEIMGASNPLSNSSEEQMIDVFVDTLLSPVFYSSTIIVQNEDNASVVDALKIIEISQTTSPAAQTISATPTAPTGGTY